jgi:hypothetical protein
LGVVTGSDFSRPEDSSLQTRAFQIAKEVDCKNAFEKGFVTGHDFSRAENANQIIVGL